MAVGIYTSPDPTTLLSEDGLFTKPFSVTFDGRLGGYKEVRLYIRNDDALYYYTNMILSLTDSNSPSILSRPEDGYAWKMSYGDLKPTYNDWLAIPANNSIVIDDIGESGNSDISSYLPFWVFIQVPSNIPIQTFTSVKFNLTGQEILA